MLSGTLFLSPLRLPVPPSRRGSDIDRLARHSAAPKASVHADNPPCPEQQPLTHQRMLVCTFCSTQKICNRLQAENPDNFLPKFLGRLSTLAYNLEDVAPTEMNIKKVAARAKVSTATISRTINNSAAVSPDTAKKVWKAIRELGYYPNTQARALVSGRSKIFGLIISDIANPFFPELVKSFDDTAIRHGYDVIVANTDYDSDRMNICARRMIERQVDAVAIMTSEIDEALIDELSRRKLPIVFLDHGHPGPLISNIVVDYGKGIREAVQHLAGLGHRNIGFVSGPLALKSARTRRAAFLRCLKECGIGEHHQIVVEGNHKVDGGERAMQQLLAMQPAPTAVLTSNDLTAIGVLRAIHYAGLRVPDDISVIGFDDIELSQYTQPALTTVRLSREELGRCAFEALYRTLQNGNREGQQIKISTTLVIRDSTSVSEQVSLRKAALTHA